MAETAITIDATEAEAFVGRSLDVLTGKGRREANLRGGRALQNHLIKYHRDFAARKGWDNPDSPTHGPGRKDTQFGRTISQGWDQVTATATGATVYNTHKGRGKHPLRLKIKGHPVHATRAKAMTIPVDPRAHGRRTREFESVHGHHLFRIAGSDILWIDEAEDRLTPIYVLKKMAKHKDWPGALPPDAEMAEVFARELVMVLDEKT